MEIKEIRIHGRGGLGAYTASQIISHAALYDNKFAQSFPEFGAERRGAPIKAYARVSSKEIDLRSNIADADVIIVIHPKLIPLSSWGFREDSTFIASTNEFPVDLRKKYEVPTNVELWSVDGMKIAMEEIGAPIPNVTMLGAFAKALEEEIVTLNSLERGTEDVGRERSWGEERLSKNIEAMEKAYNEVRKDD